MPNTFKVSEVLTIIKKKLHIARDQQQGIVLLADGKYLMKHDSPLSDIYQKYKDADDGFLYIIYAEEQIYGWFWFDQFIKRLRWSKSWNQRETYKEVPEWSPARREVDQSILIYHNSNDTSSLGEDSGEDLFIHLY